MTTTTTATATASTATKTEPEPLRWREGALATALPLAIVLGCTLLEAVDGRAYRALVQEDGVVEWATVVACLLAAPFFAREGWRSGRVGRLPWFPVGLALFCVFVAGEEVSWLQRVTAYQPPEYFLAHNAQQELNLHNLFKDVLRTKYLLLALAALYGIVLPAAWRWRRGRALLERLRVRAPTPLVAPSALAVIGLVVVYPWPYTGEVAELVFALLLLIGSILPTDDRSRRPHAGRIVSLAVLATALAAVAIPAGTNALTRGDDPRIAVANDETRTIARDWLAELEASPGQPSGCGTHVRVYTWVERHGHRRIREGSFATGEAADPTYDDPIRRTYFLDPWNNPYWLWHRCDGGSQRVMVYSFGPNRRRDSTRRGARPDDVGTELTR